MVEAVAAVVGDSAIKEYSFIDYKGSDHLGPSWGGLGRFLGSQ